MASFKTASELRELLGRFSNLPFQLRNEQKVELEGKVASEDGEELIKAIFEWKRSAAECHYFTTNLILEIDGYNYELKYTVESQEFILEG